MKNLKLLTLLLIIAIIIGIIPKFALAEETLPEPGEEHGFLQPIEQKTEVPEGYTGIYTADDLEGIRNALDKSYILMNDIDLSETDQWTPIGIGNSGKYNWEYDPVNPTEKPLWIQDKVPFCGIFDGNGYSITGLKTKREFESVHLEDKLGDFAFCYAGLFGALENSTVKNLFLKDADVDISGGDRMFAGVLAGVAYENVHIENCICSGVNNVSSKYVYAGGILGVSEAYDTDIEYCANYTDVTVRLYSDKGHPLVADYCAGITSYINEGKVVYCINKGNIENIYSSELESSGKYADMTAGGICGVATHTEFADCSNEGNIHTITEDVNLASKYMHSTLSTGGILGGGMTDILRCSNSGDVLSEVINSNAGEKGFDQICGGIVGLHNYYSITECQNSGRVSVLAQGTEKTPIFTYAGGIAGLYDGSDYVTKPTIERCFNTGEITAQVQRSDRYRCVTYIGGLTGYNEHYLAGKGKIRIIADCYNVGDVKADAKEVHMGGICGLLNLTLANEENAMHTSIENCYNSGSLEVNAQAFANGGIIGWMRCQSALENNNALTIKNCYYADSTEKAVMTYANGSLIAKYVNVSSLNSEQLTEKNSYIGFNFVKVWGIDAERNGGCPYLRAFYGEVGEAQPGDVNMDGIINTADAVEILKNSAGMIQLDDEQTRVADMNSDGNVNTSDAVAVLKYCAGM